MIRRPPRSPLFPSTTLSRSNEPAEDVAAVVRHQLPRLHDDAHGASDQAAGTETDAARRKIREIVGGRDDVGGDVDVEGGDRKSTRLNSSHREISYAVFCLKKKRSKSEHKLHVCGGASSGLKPGRPRKILPRACLAPWALSPVHSRHAKAGCTPIRIYRARPSWSVAVINGHPIVLRLRLGLHGRGCRPPSRHAKVIRRGGFCVVLGRLFLVCWARRC